MKNIKSKKNSKVYQMANIAGFFIDRFTNKKYLCVVGMILGTAVCYLLGTLWLASQPNIPASSAFSVGVIPFIPADLVKIMISAYLGPKIRNLLLKSHLFQV